MTAGVWRRRLMTGLYVFLALEFVVGAVTKYMPGETFYGPPYSVKFVEWGYPSWMRFVVGGLELLGAVLLLIPSRRTRFLAATTLVFVLTGAVTTHIVNHDAWFESVAAPVHLVIMGVLALANWPADWRDVLRPSAPPARQSHR
ncbi:DoxX family protein [Nonomuraea candida]|uniref:DoxX family protein n=1 Tax=Nonomuraea candida TaxID=359159 RepID=UPI000B1A41DF|nr:DoxX family protein [Nonomuraea candida]